MWIKCISGILINSDAVSEFGIKSSTSCGFQQLYDFPDVTLHYIFATMQIQPSGKVYCDESRNIIDVVDIKLANKLLESIGESIQNGDTYWDAYKKCNLCRKQSKNEVICQTKNTNREV